MTPERVFTLCNSAALAGWIVLAVAPRRRWASAVVSGLLIPALLALVYAVLIALHLGEGRGGFGSLAAVSALFANPWLLLAGWVHYLAFDLFIGSWEARDAERSGVGPRGFELHRFGWDGISSRPNPFHFEVLQ